MISTPKRLWGAESRTSSGRLRAGMTKLIDPRFVIRATRFHRGTRGDRIAVVRDLLDTAEPVAITARMAAFLASYCGVESAAAFCGIVEELQCEAETPDLTD